MTDLVGHFFIFTTVAVLFLLAPLVLGRLLRPTNPSPEKLAAYECGEPTIGSSYVQFDLRFYVVALLFIIFDVEVAFFFPWAAVYGSAIQLADVGLAPDAIERVTLSAKLLGEPAATLAASNVFDATTAYNLALFGFGDILVFFSVLLLGFAYVWKRGDLDWVRAMTEQSKHLAATRKLQARPAPEKTLEPVG